jgi:hypothetical protein
MKKILTFSFLVLFVFGSVVFYATQPFADEMPKPLSGDTVPCESTAQDCLEKAAAISDESDEELLNTPHPIGEEVLQEIEDYIPKPKAQ